MVKEKIKITKGAVIKEPGSTAKYKTGNWRTFRPVIDQEKCIRCGLCWSQCPDAAIKEKNGKFVIDYNYCKGCGICAENCPVKAIKMVREEK